MILHVTGLLSFVVKFRREDVHASTKCKRSFPVKELTTKSIELSNLPWKENFPPGIWTNHGATIVKKLKRWIQFETPQLRIRSSTSTKYRRDVGYPCRSIPRKVDNITSRADHHTIQVCKSSYMQKTWYYKWIYCLKGVNLSIDL